MKLVVVLHNIRSVHNVGSIFRTADGAGAEKIYLCGITPSPLDRFGKLRGDFVKVALGAERFVPWESMKSTAAAIKRLKKEGWQILALEQHENSTDLFEFPKAKTAAHDANYCLVLGDEVRGVPPSLLKLADKIIEIPLCGKKESLNVAVAFGIAAFTLRRQ
jgi:23S rRNA (guanosine2251-2'-O)-methyltransferase